MAIHETAVISPKARIGSNVEIGPFAVIGTAEIGDGSIIHPHAVIADSVRLGSRVEVFPGAVIGREPNGAAAATRPIGFHRQIEVGSDCSVGPHAVIYYDVVIGDGTLIGDGASIREQCRIGSHCLISRYVTLNYNARIGDRVKIMDLTHLTGNIVVEDDAFVSCLVATTNDNVISQGYGDHVVGPTIGRRAIIGAGATLLPGLEVGENAFVGAGSVVTRTVDGGVLVVGVPAAPRH